MGKKKDAPAEEGLPLWMATFADMVTLLLTFFVLLLSFANQDIVMFKDIMGSIQNALGVRVERQQAEYLLESPSYTPQEGKKTIVQEQRMLKAMAVRIKDSLQEDSKLRRSTGVVADRNGVLVQIDSNAVFDPNSTELTSTGKVFLDKMYAVFREYNYNLVVRGHTDNSQSKSSVYPSNWELSAARASAAVRFLLDKGGISPSRVKAVGYADTRPIAPNDSPQNRAKNNRVEFYMYRPTEKAW
ncbi:OmpA/MotB family protein [Desulfovibrio inopinatus]|uniref:OmpA/MotB family protein n=1 Tax=Desulfovibrio inopinatus TaxID=102109 RepID=UPI00040057DE|nr:flagellar motor protein MotB [Desulfovibrio inopinatus]